MIQIRELIEEFRPNSKPKYYEILDRYIERIMVEDNAKFSITVEGLIADTDTTRPTFYKYFQNVECFYQEIAKIYFGILPSYFAAISKELKNQDMVQITFRMKSGVVIRNLLRLSGIIPSVDAQLKDYFRNGVRNMGEWYQREFGMDPTTAEEMSRLVLNELIINADYYYNNLAAYTTLMRNQSPTALSQLNRSVNDNFQ